MRRKPLKAKKGKAVTQMYYAKQGIITPEMEYIAMADLGSRAKTWKIVISIFRVIVPVPYILLYLLIFIR